MISIRDLVRRERWEMNRGAHEAEILLSGLASRDWEDEGDDGWNAIAASYGVDVVNEGQRMLAQQLVR